MTTTSSISTRDSVYTIDSDSEPPEPANPTEVISDYVAFRLSLTDATNDLLAPIHAALSSPSESENEKANILLFSLWQSLFDVVALAPSPTYSTGKPNATNIAYLSNLVKLVDAVHDALPTGQYSWFSPEARNRWNFTPTSPAQAAGWTNLNSFLMLCWMLHPEDRDRPVFEYSLNAVWSLRLALETPQKPLVLDALVPGAACWVCYRDSGRRIFASESQWTPDEDVGAPAKAGRLWRERIGEQEDGDDDVADMNGFTRRRWAFWKQRFAEISKVEAVSEETRITAAAAAKAMEEVGRE